MEAMKPEHLHSVTIDGVEHYFTDLFGPYLNEDDAGKGKGKDAEQPDDPSVGAQQPEPQGEPPKTPDEAGHTQTSGEKDGEATKADADKDGKDVEAKGDGETVEIPAVPEVPEAFDDLDEDALREKFDELTAARAARVDPSVARTPELAKEVTAIAQAQTRIKDEIEGRAAALLFAQAEVDAAEVVELPEKPTAADQAKGVKAAAVAGARKPQPASQQKPPESRDRPKAAMVAAIGISDSLEGEEVDFATLGEAIEAHKDKPGSIDYVPQYDDDGNVVGTLTKREGGIVLAGLPGYSRMAAQGADVPEVLDGRVGIERVDELIRTTQDAFRDRRKALRRGEDVDGATARLATICDPLDPIREIPSAFTDEERVSPTFPSRPVGRGGFQFTPSLHLTDVAAGVRTWTEADQAAVDPNTSSTWKPIVDVTCGSPTPVRAEAVTYGIRYDNTTEMSSPERVQNAMEALQAQRARQKESRVLQLLDATLSAYTMESDFGAVPAFIDTINSLIPILKYADRLEDGGFTVVVPEGLVAALGIDRSKRNAVDNDLQAANILAQLQASLWMVDNVVVKLDAARGGLEPGAPPPAVNPVGSPAVDVPTIDDTYRVRIYDPSGYIYGETGQQNVGVLRDSGTVRQNKTIFFGEEYLLLAKNGPQPGAFVDVNLCASGQRAGNLTAVGCNPGT